jgi:hypothetical protein
MQLLINLKNNIVDMIRETRAQDAFEYILIVGGVSVAIIVALALSSNLIDPIINGVACAIEDIGIDMGTACT